MTPDSLGPVGCRLEWGPLGPSSNSVSIDKILPVIDLGAGASGLHNAPVSTWRDTFHHQSLVSEDTGVQIRTSLSLPIPLSGQLVRTATAYEDGDYVRPTEYSLFDHLPRVNAPFPTEMASS